MKRTFFLAAAMTPMLALAGGGEKLGVKTEELKDDWRVSDIIGSEVQSQNGETVGEVQDVVLGQDGRVESLLVSAEGGTMTQPASASTGSGSVEPGAAGDGGSQVVAEDRTQIGMRNTGSDRDELMTQNDTQGSDPTASLGQAGDSRVTAASELDGGNAMAVSWNNPQFDGENRVLTVDAQPGEIQAVSTGAGGSQETGASGEGKHKASELLDMEVALSDEESFGDVEDVFVSSDGEVSAVLVNAGGFMSEESYALPANFERINMQENTIEYDFARTDVESQARIDLDQLEQSQEGQ